jgi:hypothetical protein
MMSFSKTVRKVKVKPTGKPKARVTSVTTTKKAIPIKGGKLRPPSVIIAPVRTWFDERERTGPSHATDVIRASSAKEYCARAEALLRFGDSELPLTEACGLSTAFDNPGMNLNNTLEIGTAVHAHWQEEILGPAGILLGSWWCKSCKRPHGPFDEYPTNWIPQPPECDCGSTRFEFTEAYKKDIALGLAGHMDGCVKLPDGELAGMEIKTISASGFDGLTSPKTEHKTQANIYMYLFGLKKMVFLYISKGWHQSDYAINAKGKTGHECGPFKEFTLEYDPSLIQEIILGREHAALVIEAFDTGGTPVWPHRKSSCKDIASTRACICPVADACFGAL